MLSRSGEKFTKFTHLFAKMTDADSPETFDKLYKEFATVFANVKGPSKAASPDEMGDNDEREEIRKYSPVEYSKYWFGDDNDHRYRDKIVKFHVEKSSDFFNLSSSRVGGVHAHYRRYMRTRRMSIFASGRLLIRTNLGLLANMNHRHAMKMSTHVMDRNHDWLDDNIQKSISAIAKKKVHDQYELRYNDNMKEDCSGSFKSRNQLPCAHAVGDIAKTREGGRLVLRDFHPRYRLFHLTKQMTDDEWEQACTVGVYAEEWQQLRAREERFKCQPPPPPEPRSMDILDKSIVNGSTPAVRMKSYFVMDGKRYPNCKVCQNPSHSHVTKFKCFKDRFSRKDAMKHWNRYNFSGRKHDNE